MSPIDYILRFTDAATAKADAQMLASALGADDQGVKQFRADHCLVFAAVWRNSQDTTTTGTGPDGQQITVPVHHPMTGFFVLVSLQQIVPALRDHAAVQLVIDRDKLNARQAGMIIRSTVGAVVLQDIRFSPVFAGMDPPWGSLS